MWDAAGAELGDQPLARVVAEAAVVDEVVARLRAVKRRRSEGDVGFHMLVIGNIRGMVNVPIERRARSTPGQSEGTLLGGG